MAEAVGVAAAEAPASWQLLNTDPKAHISEIEAFLRNEMVNCNASELGHLSSAFLPSLISPELMQMWSAWQG